MTGPDGRATGVLDDAKAMQEDLRTFRRAMHADPEVGLDLPRTQERVLKALDGLDVEITLGEATTSVTGVIRGTADPQAQRAVLLRADMDALPVHELADVPYRSRTDGAMHACGHDLHTAILVGAARLLAARRAELAGDVVLMFQPGEEGWHGARTMVQEGVLDAAGPRVSAAYGLHVFSGTGLRGGFLTRPGAMLAASDELLVTFHGKGGHGSAPHRAKDPVPAAAELVGAIQTAVTRELDPFDPVVATTGLLRAGTKSNVIPDDAHVETTVRTFSPEHRDRAAEVLDRVARGVALAHGLDVDVQWRGGFPVTVNDEAETEFVESVLTDLFTADRHDRLEDPLTGSEDFSYVLNEVPGAFVGLGACPPDADPDSVEYNHSPRVVFDDDVLSDGAALLAELAIRRLSRRTAENG